MRKFPFNDKNIRYAFGYLYDREKMNREMYYNQYEMMHSWVSGSMYENEDNIKFLYNPEKAIEHLKLAGFEKKNDEGILINSEGKPLRFEIAAEKGHTYMVTPVQNMLKQYGIDMQIINMDGTTEWKNRNERNFKIYLHSFTGSVHPSFEQWFRSDLADLNDNTNFFGLKDGRIDQLIIDYNKEFDLDKRITIGKEIDGIICDIHPVSFGIKRLYTRLLFWDKFSYPEYMLDRFVGSWDSIYYLWWFDPKKVNRLEKAMKNDTQLPVSEIDIRFWPDWIEKQK
jgi:ABC-type transport system substrate-binding protein